MTPIISAPNSSADGDVLVGNLSLNLAKPLDPANGSPVSSFENETTSKTPSSAGDEQGGDEDDFNTLELDPANVLRGSKGGGLRLEPTLDIPQEMNFGTRLGNNVSQDSSRQFKHDERRQSFSIKLEKTGEKGRYILKADDPELRDILRRGLQRESEIHGKKKRSRFSDLVFTRQFTAFDRQNSESSPFRGFYTLFWLSTFMMLVKVAANNWKIYGSVFGRNEILAMMFHRDVLLLGITDGVVCASTVFCLLLQKAISAGYLSWNRSGWIIQNIWQSLFLGATIRWTIHRDWPWSHTVFIVLHCIAMLMKQHSYSFYNGYLSETFLRKKMLEKKLKQLSELELVISPSATPSSPSALASSYFDAKDMSSIHRRRSSMNSKSKPQLQRQESDLAKIAAAIGSEAPLDFDQIQCFERIIKMEIESSDEELNGKCSDGQNSYPLNLNLRDFAGYIPLPTVVYELEYPRQDHINWYYVAEKTAATFGVLGVMIVVSQAYIYPAVITCLNMKEQGMPLQQRLQEFPWVLSDLLFPFVMEYLLAWYVIWECILNVLAELTLFADRGFYADWWNSTSWDQFSRDWNRPVHAFLLRHVYHSSISSLHISRSTATLFTFFLSACVHELVMWCIFKKLRGYLMAMQMMQLPLVGLSRMRWMKGKNVLGNVIFWLGIFTGPSFLCSLYLIL